MNAPSVRTTLATAVVGLLVTVVVFGSTVALLLGIPSLRPWIAAFLVAAVTLQALAMLAVARHFLRRNGISWSGIGFNRPTRRLFHLFWQIPAGFVAALGVQGLAFSLTGRAPGGASDGIDFMASSGGPIVAALLLLSIAVLTPLWEEVLFRGMIQGSARARLGRFAGVAISALAFAAAHGAPALLPYMFVVGCTLALLREFHGNLWGPLAMHCTLNTAASTAVLAAMG